MDKKDDMFIKGMEKQFVLPQTALRMREAGYPQGRTPYLWHKEKRLNFTTMRKEDHWVLYKRNKYDISAFGDSHGYNRWVSAPTINQTKEWAGTLREMKESLKDTGGLIDFLRIFLEFLEDREEDKHGR